MNGSERCPKCGSPYAFEPCRVCGGTGVGEDELSECQECGGSGSGAMVYCPRCAVREHPAAALRALAAELRRVATPRGLEPRLAPSPDTVLGWAARLDEIAAQVEREEAQG